MLAATFSLPTKMVVDVLQRIQTSLTALLTAPPQARFLFEPEAGFEALLESNFTTAALTSNAADATPTGGDG